VIGAIELGGSHVSSALVELGSGRVQGLTRVSLEPDAPRAELLSMLRAAADRVRPAGTIGFAVPGPFDYDRGICLIRGLGKLESLYGVELPAALDVTARFVNDAESFLLGEWVAGAARGHERAVGITLGTGLGSAFLAGGELVREGAGVPPNGDLHTVPFRGGAVEDLISGRGICLRGGSDAETLAERAAAGDASALATFASFGADLAEFLEPWLRAFQPTVVVVGGGIARAWRLFCGGLPALAVPARRADTAALIGAAVFASGRSSSPR
jgi:glucokinase